MPIVQIGSRIVGDGHPCFVIAEIGINHNGSLETAKQLIDIAVTAGCEAVKFQKRTIEVVYTEEELAKHRETPFGNTNGELKRHLEFGKEQYGEIDRYCKSKGIMWFASPWDEGSVDFLEQFDVPCYKVASASLTDRGLLERMRATEKSIIVSTGMSTMEQVREALAVLEPNPVVLLHCVATYPTPDDELNMSVITTLKREFPSIPIGYSGHSKSMSPGVWAVVLGACMVERHVTLDRTMWGSDQAASLEPSGLTEMIHNIRRVERAMGTGEKFVLPSEVPIREKLRRVTDF